MSKAIDELKVEYMREKKTTVPERMIGARRYIELNFVEWVVDRLEQLNAETEQPENK